jgi:hypothetical protein
MYFVMSTCPRNVFFFTLTRYQDAGEVEKVTPYLPPLLLHLNTMQNFVDFEEYGNVPRDFMSNPESFIDRLRHNGTYDDELARTAIEGEDVVPESYIETTARLPKHAKHYYPVAVHHKGKRYIVSGQMVHSLVPSFKQAASGWNAKEGEYGIKYPVVSEERDVHTSPMWKVSASANGTMRVTPDLENTFDQNIKNADMHVGAVIDGEDNKSFFSIHGLASLIGASLKGGRNDVFSFKPEASTKDLSIASKMAPALDNLKDNCHSMSVGAEMVAPINKKLANIASTTGGAPLSPVHLVIEEGAATTFPSTFQVAGETKQSETVSLTAAAAHVNAMKISAPMKSAILQTLGGAYMEKRLLAGKNPVKAEAFYGNGRAYSQVATPHLSTEESHVAHNYTEEPASTMFVGVRLNNDESIVCHVTNDGTAQKMTTIKTVPSSVNDAMVTKVTNMNGKSFSAQRVQSSAPAGVRGAGRAFTFVH